MSATGIGTAVVAGGTRNVPSATGASTGNNRNQNKRNNNYQNGRNGHRNDPRIRNTSTFEGTVPETNRHVFQCHSEATQKNHFTCSMEELDNYVGLHFKHHPADIQKMIRSMNNTTIAIPKDHEEKASKTRIRIWEKEVDLYMKRQELYNSNKRALYSVIWGQCSEAMEAKIKYDNSYDTYMRTMIVWNSSR